MPKPGEHKAVQTRILACAGKIGRRCLPKLEVLQ